MHSRLFPSVHVVSYPLLRVRESPKTSVHERSHLIKPRPTPIRTTMHSYRPKRIKDMSHKHINMICAKSLSWKAHPQETINVQYAFAFPKNKFLNLLCSGKLIGRTDLMGSLIVIPFKNTQ